MSMIFVWYLHCKFTLWRVRFVLVSSGCLSDERTTPQLTCIDFKSFDGHIVFRLGSRIMLCARF